MSPDSGKTSTIHEVELLYLSIQQWFLMFLCINWAGHIQLTTVQSSSKMPQPLAFPSISRKSNFSRTNLVIYANAGPKKQRKEALEKKAIMTKRQIYLLQESSSDEISGHILLHDSVMITSLNYYCQTKTNQKVQLSLFLMQHCMRYLFCQLYRKGLASPIWKDF